MKCLKCHIEVKAHRYGYCLACYKRLEGVPGPEQGLVGESRSDRQQGHAEDAKPGERGVGEIVNATELLEIIDTLEHEARLGFTQTDRKTDYPTFQYFLGQLAVLAVLRARLPKPFHKRSDLANARAMPPANESDHGK